MKTNKTGDRRRVPVGLRSSIVSPVPLTVGAFERVGSSEWFVTLQFPEAMSVLQGLVDRSAPALQWFHSQYVLNLTDDTNQGYDGLVTGVDVPTPAPGGPYLVVVRFEADVSGTIVSAYLALPVGGEWCVSAARGVGIGGIGTLPTVPQGSVQISSTSIIQ